MAAGDDYAGHTSLYRTPLSRVLPAAPTGRVIEQPFKARITSVGLKHPVTSSLPGATDKEPTWGRWFRQVEARPDRGRTIMHGADDQPLLVLDRQGKGRVALMLSDHAWLWARGFDGGGPHTPLLRRLAHWLMKEPDLEEERLKAFSKGLKVTIERHSMEDSVADVEITTPAGETSRVRLDKAGPGVWRSVVDAKQPGLYKMQSRATTGNLTALVHVGLEDEREMSEVTATDTKLKPVLDGTGAGAFWTRAGGLLASADPASVSLPRITMMGSAKVLAGSGWMGLRDREAYVTRGVSLTPMFTGLLALAALLALLAATWWREGR